MEQNDYKKNLKEIDKNRVISNYLFFFGVVSIIIAIGLIGWTNFSQGNFNTILLLNIWSLGFWIIAVIFMTSGLIISSIRFFIKTSMKRD
jgi:hypothetical protein